MAVALDLSARIVGIINSHEVPVVAIDKLREINVVEVAEFVGMSAHARDLGDFFQLLKIWDMSPDVALRTKIWAMGICSECRAALEPDKTTANSCQITRRLFTPQSKKTDDSDADASAD